MDSFAVLEQIKDFVYKNLANEHTLEMNGSIPVPKEIEELFNKYIEVSDGLISKYEVLSIIIRMATTILDRYNAWRGFIENNVQDYPDLADKYKDFVRYQEHSVVRY